MATEILKKQTIVGTDAQYEANRNSYGEGTVFESTSLLGENDIDPAYTNKFVERKVSTTGLYAYCFDPTGITKTRYISEGFPAYSLVERDEKGRVRTADPEGQNDATNKKYVDDNFVPKTTTARRVYATDDAGNQKPVNYTHEISANSMMIRDGSGRAKIQTPLVADQIANKRYVDDNFISKYINGGIVYANDTSGSQTGIEYSETADKGTIAIRDESGHVRTADPEGQNDAVNKS